MTTYRSFDKLALEAEADHLFALIDVNGDGAHPLFTLLKKEAPGVLGTECIKWNFTKFLVGKDGTVAARYASTTGPESISADIERLLQA